MSAPENLTADEWQIIRNALDVYRAVVPLIEADQATVTGIDRRLATIAAHRKVTDVYLAARAETPPRNTPCSSCGMTDEDCNERVHHLGRPCCGSCHLRDTHNAL